MSASNSIITFLSLLSFLGQHMLQSPKKSAVLASTRPSTAQLQKSCCIVFVGPMLALSHKCVSDISETVQQKMAFQRITSVSLQSECPGKGFEANQQQRQSKRFKRLERLAQETVISDNDQEKENNMCASWLGRSMSIWHTEKKISTGKNSKG